MIAALIENYKELTVVGVFAIMMAWYLWHQTRRQSKREDKQDEERTKRQEKRDKDQKEERDYYRNLINNDMEEMHKNDTKNTGLHNQSLALLKDIGNNQTKLTVLIESVDRKINGKK